MSSERDTHFQGFARSLLAELQAEEYAISSTNDYAVTLIAQRAYDLALHVTGHVAATTMDSTLVLKHVPDLTEWPVESAEGNVSSLRSKGFL